MTTADCEAFPEINNCSGSGLGYCDMTFTRPDRCLIVVTIGGRPDTSATGETKIGGSTVQEGACAASATNAKGGELMAVADGGATVAATADAICAKRERQGISSTVLVGEFSPEYPGALQDPVSVEQQALGADEMTDVVRTLACGAGLSGFGPDVPEAALALFASRRHGAAAMTALRQLSVGGDGIEAIAARNFLERIQSFLKAAREGKG